MESNTHMNNLQSTAPLGQPDPVPVDFKIAQYDAGVYRVKVARKQRQPGSLKAMFTTAHITQAYRDTKAFVLDIFRFLGEVYSIAPTQFAIIVGGYVWNHISDPISIYIRAMTLHSIETSLKSGKSNHWGIIISLTLFWTSSMITTFVRWTIQRRLNDFGERIRRHFEFRLMRESLGKDLATATEKSGHESVTANQAKNYFMNLCTILGNYVGVLGQVALTLDTCRRVGHPALIILSFKVLPLVLNVWKDNIYSQKCIAYNINEPDKRMKALSKLSQANYRQDVILGGLAEWIITEFGKAFEARGDVPSVGHPLRDWNRSQAGPRARIFDRVAKDLPLVYMAFLSTQNPESVSLSSITILAESSLRLMRIVRSHFFGIARLQRVVDGIRKIYHEGGASSKMQSGALSYPVASTSGGEDDTEGGTSKRGMRFDLRNVSFRYPGNQSTKPALDAVSITIRPGQVVLLVGKNGSGKSTLIKILSRLYEHTSGDVLIDNRPSGAYHLGDVKRAIALLSQDNKIYPLSLGENIGVGQPEKFTDEGLIRAAAEDGGASSVIAKLKDGFETKLDPMIDILSLNLHKHPDHPLSKEMEAMKKKIEISGGEQQRVVAARTFMRMNSEEVKFVAVDEPTSALDADGELHLFNRLIARREGKTMVFVTHRFGHLTKQADLIICMDEGQVVESGSHEQLLEMGGEYAKLYNAQASAYSS